MFSDRLKESKPFYNIPFWRVTVNFHGKCQVQI